MKIDLYRLFFPAGFLLGFWGTFVWVLYSLNLIEYPGALHPEIMMGGFLLTFVLGFLCTAVPKFTDSFPATNKEIGIAVILTVSLFFAQIKASIFVFRLCSFSIFIYLAFFIIRRFLNRKANPPAPFVFVGVGVFTGLSGSFILLLSDFGPVHENVYTLGRLFLLQAYILSFVLGVGSRLIPALLGFAPPPDQLQKNSLSVKTYLILGIIYLCTYFIEAFVIESIGMYLRDLIILFIAIFTWKIYQLPKRKAIHSYGLWLSCWFIILGHIGASLFLESKIHFMHLFYIGGLSLMTLLVATRVTLSHGGHGTALESRSKTLLALVVLFSLASLTRLSAGLLPDLYLTHLLYAAIIWLIALVLWALLVIPKVIVIKN